MMFDEVDEGTAMYKMAETIWALFLASFSALFANLIALSKINVWGTCRTKVLLQSF